MVAISTTCTAKATLSDPPQTVPISINHKMKSYRLTDDTHLRNLKRQRSRSSGMLYGNGPAAGAITKTGAAPLLFSDLKIGQPF